MKSHQNELMWCKFKIACLSGFVYRKTFTGLVAASALFHKQLLGIIIERKISRQMCLVHKIVHMAHFNREVRVH